ncbi:MAG: YdbL family protein [Myxococcota bacterium]|nr:YdbL family protein [Myxococcota bacterium]
MRLDWRAAAMLLLSGLALLVALPATASELDQAKASGEVGEQVDGYVGLVKGKGTAAARALVERVNAGRRKAYADIARANGIAVEAVAARAGERLVKRAGPGEWVRDSSGSWKRN